MAVLNCRILAWLQKQFHVETLMVYKLGFNQNYFTFSLILLIKLVLCGNFPRTMFINYVFRDEIRDQQIRKPLYRAPPGFTR